MTRPPGYGIIYNWDGSPYGYSEWPQSIDRLLEKVYAPLQDTQVGALFWCTGTHAATWPSDVLELVGDFRGRRYRTAGEYIAAENLRSMLERGEDPIRAIVDRGHELGLHVYASVRMNDNHFDGMRPDEMASSGSRRADPNARRAPGMASRRPDLGVVRPVVELRRA